MFLHLSVIVFTGGAVLSEGCHPHKGVHEGGSMKGGCRERTPLVNKRAVRILLEFILV